MTIKRLFCKQVIISISKTNVNNIMVLSANYITNINRALKNIKFKVIVNYIWSETMEITIISNAVVTLSNF